MTSDLCVYRFEPGGPDGLKPVTLDPGDFSAMPSAQNQHVYFQDEALGLSTGVWDTTTMQEAFGPYPGDEFIVVLDGAFEMRSATGTAVRARKGQSVVLRNGIPVSWKQDGYLKKFYMLYKDPRAQTPDGLSAAEGVRVLSKDMELDDRDLLQDTSTPQRDKVLYTNDCGNFEVGLWDTQTLNTELAPFPWHEFAQVLEGSVTLTEADGTAHHFKPGDAFFIPAGTVCAWTVSTYLRKYYASLNPDIRPDG